MNNNRVRLLVAIVLALGTGILTLRYLSSVGNTAPQQASMREILVAGADIPARVKITREMLRRSLRAENEIEPGAISDAARVDGTLALISIPAGTTITEQKIGRPTDVGLTVKLPRGMRALSISIDRVRGVSGLIQPGDRVDVIAVPPRTGTETPKGATILRGALVLAVNAAMESAAATPSPDNNNPQTVALAVTPDQANLLAMADQSTTLHLALRSPREPIRSLPVQPLVFADSRPASPPEPHVAAPVVQQAVPAPAATPQAPSATSRPAGSSVTVIDGDQVVNGR